MIENLSQAIQAGADHSLSALGIDPEDALADLHLLGELIQARLPEQQAIVEALYLRYARAPAPHPGQSACLAYRMRNLFLDRWSLWPRLTFYRTCLPANSMICHVALAGREECQRRGNLGWHQ